MSQPIHGVNLLHQLPLLQQQALCFSKSAENYQQMSFQTKTGHSLHCTMCTLYSFFSFRPNALGLIVQPQVCHVIEHIFVPTHSVERNNEKIRFPWASNSKFVIFPQIFPCSNYKICPIIPPLAMVIRLFPRSNYRGFFTTGESYCTMYTLCNGKAPHCVLFIFNVFDFWVLRLWMFKVWNEDRSGHQWQGPSCSRRNSCPAQEHSAHPLDPTLSPPAAAMW